MEAISIVLNYIYTPTHLSLYIYIFFNIYFYFMHMSVWPGSTSVHHVHEVPENARSPRVTRTCELSEVGTLNQRRSSGKAASTCNC